MPFHVLAGHLRKLHFELYSVGIDGWCCCCWAIVVIRKRWFYANQVIHMISVFGCNLLLIRRLSAINMSASWRNSSEFEWIECRVVVLNRNNDGNNKQAHSARTRPSVVTQRIERKQTSQNPGNEMHYDCGWTERAQLIERVNWFSHETSIRTNCALLRSQTRTHSNVILRYLPTVALCDLMAFH